MSAGDRISIDLPLTLMVGNGEYEDIGPGILVKSTAAGLLLTTQDFSIKEEII